MIFVLKFLLLFLFLIELNIFYEVLSKQNKI